jgi:dipeptidyl aminopeptidase/acylaminoacyl peptidase
MRTERIEFYSGGVRVRGLWRTPDAPERPMRAIVQGPGWLGLADAKAYERYHRGFTDAGIGVLAIDYRGFGASEGERGILSPAWQLEDLVNAVTYLTTREDVDPEAIGAYATGGTGGGNVVLLAAADPRVRVAISQVPVADGRDWLHRMRSEQDWIDFLRDLAEDAKQRVLTGKGRMVHPREELMVATRERRARGFKADVDARIPELLPLATAEAILAYRPIDAARGLRTPLLVVAVENDATTPTDHAVALYEAAAGPKRLLIQRHTGHYGAYEKYADVVIGEFVAWCEAYLRRPGAVVARHSIEEA